MALNNGKYKKYRTALLLRDGNRCHYCGVLMTPSNKGDFHPDGMSIDHIVPLAEGGTDDMDNLVLACRRCNLDKRTDSYHEFSLAKQTDMIIQFLMGDDYE